MLEVLPEHKDDNACNDNAMAKTAELKLELSLNVTQMTYFRHCQTEKVVEKEENAGGFA